MTMYNSYMNMGGSKVRRGGGKVMGGGGGGKAFIPLGHIFDVTFVWYLLQAIMEWFRARATSTFPSEEAVPPVFGGTCPVVGDVDHEPRRRPRATRSPPPPPTAADRRGSAYYPPPPQQPRPVQRVAVQYGETARITHEQEQELQYVRRNLRHVTVQRTSGQPDSDIYIVDNVLTVDRFERDGWALFGESAERSKAKKYEFHKLSDEKTMASSIYQFRALELVRMAEVLGMMNEALPRRTQAHRELANKIARKWTRN
jgi:hypothetical protein